MLVEVGHGLGVVGVQFALRDLVNPCPDHLAQDLATRFPADRISDHPDGVLRFYEAEGHCGSDSGLRMPRKVGTAPDGAARAIRGAPDGAARGIRGAPDGRSGA